MIIKSQRVASTASLRRLCDHVFRGEENHDVRILQGSERDVRDFWRDAQRSGSTFAIRHWQLCPEETATDSQAFEALAKLAEEYGFPASRAVLVAHGKDRVTPEAAVSHWHVLLGEVDPASGRVLSSSHDFARHEYLARLLEFEWGHRFVIGPHTKSVLARLRREGRKEAVAALSRAFEAQADLSRPKAAFDHRQHQAAKRMGIDLPEVREIVGAAWANCTGFEALKHSLAEAGLALDPGDVAGEWIVTEGKSGQHWSMRRLTRTRKAVFAQRMEELIHADDFGTGPQLRGKDPCRPGGDPGGGQDVAPIREPVGPAGGRPGIELHDGDDAPARTSGGGDGRDPSPPRSPARGGDRSPRDGGAPLGDPRRLIEESRPAVTAVFGLAQRAQAIARPAPDRVRGALARHERAEMAAGTSRLALPDFTLLEPSRARSKAASDRAKAVEADLGAATERLAGKVIDQRRRQAFILSRWLRPDTDAEAEIIELRKTRDALAIRFEAARDESLKAEAAERAARRAAVIAEAKSTAQVEALKQAAAARIAIIGRARRLLARVPVLAYVGARMLLAIAARIEEARERGFDPGPTPTRSRGGLVNR